MIVDKNHNALKQVVVFTTLKSGLNLISSLKGSIGTREGLNLSFIGTFAKVVVKIKISGIIERSMIYQF